MAGKGEVGRLKAAFLLDLFLVLPVTAAAMAAHWALHLALPGWVLCILALGIFAPGAKLADRCYERIPFAAVSLRGIRRVLLSIAVFLVLLALSALTLLLSMVSAYKS